MQMTKFKNRYREIEAIQWFPDPSLGYFNSNGVYISINTGIDALGVQYTICDVGIYTINGFAHLKPGDWLIKEDDGVHFSSCKPDAFDKRWEPL